VCAEHAAECFSTHTCASQQFIFSIISCSMCFLFCRRALLLSLSHPLFLISSLSLLSYPPSLISSFLLTLFNQLRNSQEGVVDRTLIANLLVSYFAKKRYRGMRLCRLWTTHCHFLPTRISFVVVVTILYFLASLHSNHLSLLPHLLYLTHSIPVTSLLPLPLPPVFLLSLFTFPFLQILSQLPLVILSLTLSFSSPHPLFFPSFRSLDVLSLIAKVLFLTDEQLEVVGLKVPSKNIFTTIISSFTPVEPKAPTDIEVRKELYLLFLFIFNMPYSSSNGLLRHVTCGTSAL
jgi:hypothetical protein